ncbi:MAG: hypothetical protein HY094_08550 [Candidatus Melainabacteria bacterium]|nr:hypothetical protein [Candidatus Melainabacteria bacterium]
MVRAIDTVTQILQQHVPISIQFHRLKLEQEKKEWEDCSRLVGEVKKDFINIVERELRKRLNENPILTKSMYLDIMPIPSAVIEEHIRTSGQISISSSKVPVLQELVDFVKKEGLNPFISHEDSETPGKKYDAVFQVIIPDEIIQKTF